MCSFSAEDRLRPNRQVASFMAIDDVVCEFVHGHIEVARNRLLDFAVGRNAANVEVTERDVSAPSFEPNVEHESVVVGFYHVESSEMLPPNCIPTKKALCRR